MSYTPSKTAEALAALLHCPCQFFAPTHDDDAILEALEAATERGAREGFTPVLVCADETLLETLSFMAQETDAPDTITAAAQGLLQEPLIDAEDFFAQLRTLCQEDFAEEGLDMEKELGAIYDADAAPLDRYLSYWDYGTRNTHELLLAELPTKAPWQVMAWLPMGGWNDCPAPEQMLGVCKYWYDRFGAIPTVVTSDCLEFRLPRPVAEKDAMELAWQQYFFCNDRVLQSGEDETIGTLAGCLAKSTQWFFWWD